MKSKIFILLAIICCTANISAKQYKGSFFGMKSDGTTVNTGSLQKAIDYISTKSPGDTLTLYVGRYLIGSVYLKSNVTIQLREGAVLVGMISTYDYENIKGTSALLLADGQENITIFGKGVIDGNGSKVMEQVKTQQNNGFIKSATEAAPSLIAMSNSKNISVKGIILQNACANAQVFSGCNTINIDNITTFGTVVENSKGIIFKNNSNVSLSNSYFQTSGLAIEATGNTNAKAENCKKPDGTKVTF